MIAIMTIVQVKPGHDDELTQVWQRAQELYRGHPGFRRARRLRHSDHQGHWTIESEWDSRDQYNAFVRDMGLPWIDDALGLWAEPPVTVYMEVVDEATWTPD